jgi:hypothetical protein
MNEPFIVLLVHKVTMKPEFQKYLLQISKLIDSIWFHLQTCS